MDNQIRPQQELLLDNFAIRSFRNMADGDYIAARAAFRARLPTQFLWSSQQAAEKYLKCILLLNRIPARTVYHDLDKAARLITNSGKLHLHLSEVSQEFLTLLDGCGRFRYLEISQATTGDFLRRLDWLVWDLRRYCTLDRRAHNINAQPGTRPPLIRLPGGLLEKVINSDQRHIREPLIWRNGFFGKRTRRNTRVGRWFAVTNAPLDVSPEILDHVLEYIYLPKDVVTAYRQRAHTPIQKLPRRPTS